MSETMKLRSLSQYYEELGNYDEAERLLDQCVQIREKVIGPRNPDLADDLYDLGLLNLTIDRYDKAEAVLRRALDMRVLTLGSEHPDVYETLDALAVVHLDLECGVA